MKWIVFLSLIFFIGCEETDSLSPSSKSQFLDSHNHSQGKIQSKARAYFDVELVAIESHQDHWHLRASVQARQNQEAVKIEWKWPEKAQVLEGEAQTQTRFEVGKTQHFDVILSADSLESGDQVFFFAYIKKGEMRLGATKNIIFGQDPEDSETKKNLKKQQDSGTRFLQ